MKFVSNFLGGFTNGLKALLCAAIVSSSTIVFAGDDGAGQASQQPTATTHPSFGPVTSSSQSFQTLKPSKDDASSSSSSGSSDGSSNEASGQSTKSSYASSNASLSIPGHYAEKVPGAAVAVSSAEEGYLRIKSGWVVTFAYRIFNQNKPTLILLPGIFRGLEKEEECLRILEAMKINYVAVHYSTHNKSILRLRSNEAPHFDGGEPNLSQVKFAHEIEAVRQHLDLKKPVVVALSYSSAVVPFLNSTQFPVLIQTAPMGRPDENNLLGAAVQSSWEQWLALNPMVGVQGVQTAKNYYFHSIWNSVVKYLSEQMPSLKDEKIFQKQVDGYVAMTFASEGFDLTKVNLNNGIKTAWILAESEDPTRAGFQAQAVKSYLSSLDKNTLKNSIFGTKGVFIVKGAGHTVPQDQPALYAGALSEIVKSIEVERTFSK